jgi:hypothetical protein
LFLLRRALAGRRSAVVVGFRYGWVEREVLSICIVCESRAHCDKVVGALLAELSVIWAPLGCSLEDVVNRRLHSFESSSHVDIAEWG